MLANQDHRGRYTDYCVTRVSFKHVPNVEPMIVEVFLVPPLVIVLRGIDSLIVPLSTGTRL